MSGYRYEITEVDGEMLIDGAPTDFAPPWKTENAISQQSRDIEQLRAELAAAVAERERVRNEARIACDGATALMSETLRLRARLAAIDAAPTVATVIDIGDECGENKNVSFYDYKLPPIGTELIARPAKEAT